MGLEMRTIEQGVWVCDMCGGETNNDTLQKCSSCGKEICSRCKKWYDFRVQRETPSSCGGYNSIRIDTHTEGLRTTLCSKCANQLERRLVALGFSKYSHDWHPV